MNSLGVSSGITEHKATNDSQELYKKRPSLLLIKMSLGYERVHMYQCVVGYTDDRVETSILVICKHQSTAEHHPEDVYETLKLKETLLLKCFQLIFGITATIASWS